MRNLLSQTLGLLIAVFLGAFAVILIGCTLRGDIYALMLLIAEIALLVFPEFFPKGRLPKHIDKRWDNVLILWMLAMFWWILYQMKLIA